MSELGEKTLTYKRIFGDAETYAGALYLNGMMLCCVLEPLAEALPPGANALPEAGAKLQLVWSAVKGPADATYRPGTAKDGGLPPGDPKVRFGALLASGTLNVEALP
jgi:hypothetical protein